MPDKVLKVECLNCKEPFIPARPWSKFCSEKCRNCYNNDRRDKKKENVIKCPHCKTDEFNMFEIMWDNHFLCNVCAKEFDYVQV